MVLQTLQNWISKIKILLKPITLKKMVSKHFHRFAPKTFDTNSFFFLFICTFESALGTMIIQVLSFSDNIAWDLLGIWKQQCKNEQCGKGFIGVLTNHREVEG